MDNSSAESASEAALCTDVEIKEMLTTEPNKFTNKLIPKLQNAYWQLKYADGVEFVVQEEEKGREKKKRKRGNEPKHIIDKTAKKRKPIISRLQNAKWILNYRAVVEVEGPHLKKTKKEKKAKKQKKGQKRKPCNISVNVVSQHCGLVPHKGKETHFKL